MSSKRKAYTDAERAAYYKKKAQSTKKKQPKKAVVPYSPREKGPGILAGLGATAGGGIGSSFGPLGTAVGSFLGGKLGHLVEKVTGFGDYQIEQNSIMKGGMTPPQIVNSVEKGGVIIRHREFITDIIATQSFTNQSFVIQPGLASTFPWLSQIACSYEQYKLRGMLFEFNSTSSDALLSTSMNTALGTVVMMTDYDVADDPPSSKRQMLQSEFASSDKPSCTFIHPVECKKSLSAQNILYTRGAIAPPTGYDPRLYDFARFNIATEGMQSTGGVLGELWVTYEIELLKPQFAFFGLTDHFRCQVVTAARPLGAEISSNVAAGGTMGGTLHQDGDQGDYYAFPYEITGGQYMWTYSVVGTSGAGKTPPVMSITNGQLLAYQAGDTISYVDCPEPAATSATTMMVGIIRVTASGCRIKFDATGVPPSTTQALDFWVVRISDSITFAPA